MKMTVFICSVIFSFLLACSGGKKQGLIDEPQTGEIQEAALYESEEVLDTIIPSGPKYKGTRKIDSSNPPVKLNLASQNKENKILDIADYYSAVRYVKLKHPLPSEEGGFLGNSKMKMYYEQGSSSGRGFNSDVYVANDFIVAGDCFFGYHCYDKDGKFDYSIVMMNKTPQYDRKGNLFTIHWDKSLRMIGSFSVLGDNCIFFTSQEGKAKLYFHNLKKKKNYLERPAWGGEMKLLNPTTFVSYYYNIRAEKPERFFSILDYKGDILSTFVNSNSLFLSQKKGASPNPDRNLMYYFNDQLTMRQAYNDTIYRVVSEKELKPVYVMDFGSQKLDVETALYGDKSNKLIPYEWFETDDFAFIIYTKNYDCPSNRQSGSVKFNYCYYDKQTKVFYNIPSDKLPEEYLINNSIEGGIPLIGNNVKANGKLLYIGYTKAQLESVIKQKDFASLPQAQQDKVNSLYDDLGEQELLVMILE